MVVSYNCQGCSSAPLTQYKNNEIYQEMTPEDEFATNERDDRILIDMRRSKGYTDELEKLNRDDRITGFSQDEYWYLLSNKGCIMSYKNYNISKADEL